MIEARINEVRWDTDTVLRFELRPMSGNEFPEFTAGAHIDLHLPNGLARSYSLLNSQNERHRYVIAVALASPSRGGSRQLHDNVRPGDRLMISGPRNLFPLDETANRTILLAGGIGVTPMLSMAKRLQELNKTWKLIYCCRSRTTAALLEDIAALQQESVELWFDDERTHFLNIPEVLRTDPHAHFYCCGPQPMIEVFIKAASDCGVDRDRTHVEYFAPKSGAATQGGYLVKLVRSDQTISVLPGMTILDAIKAAGATAASSCEAGICGECQVRVIEGMPDHRDAVLSDVEQASNKIMMICCSGSKSDVLVLDL